MVSWYSPTALMFLSLFLVSLACCVTASLLDQKLLYVLVPLADLVLGMAIDLVGQGATVYCTHCSQCAGIVPPTPAGFGSARHFCCENFQVLDAVLVLTDKTPSNT